MFYREYKPAIQLMPYIETYWVGDGYFAEKSFYKVLPDGCLDIIFSFSESKPDSRLVAHQPNIIGTMTSYLEDYHWGRVEMYGIRFRPGGFAAFTKTPINEFTNIAVDISLADTLFDSSFYEQMAEQVILDDRITFLNRYFSSMQRNARAVDRRIVHSIELIEANQGLLSLDKIAQESCLSPRHLERRFKEVVGISPKKFSTIVRFNAAAAYLKSSSSLSIWDAAFRFGYTDKSHLIKEFKIFSGSGPSSSK